MDLTVTVCAASVKEENRSLRPRCHRVTCCVMARGAEPRVCDLEQPIIDGSVRLVTVATVLKRRRMFPQKRPAPLSMAGVTVFIDAGLLELRRVRTAVRIVAIGANDFPFSQRHVRGTHELCLALQMALTANFYFRAINEERRYIGQLRELLATGLFHQCVTIDAS